MHMITIYLNFLLELNVLLASLQSNWHCCSTPLVRQFLVHSQYNHTIPQCSHALIMIILCTLTERIPSMRHLLAYSFGYFFLLLSIEYLYGLLML